MIKKIVGGFIGVFYSCSLLAQPGIQLPYCDNFDGPNLWAVDSISGIPWQLGVPDAINGFPSTVHSAPNVWGIGLSTAYSNSSGTYLISPKFDFTGIGYIQMSFWLNYNTESAWDGVRLEYSTDSVIWNTLGSVGDPAAVNWYNFTSLGCDNLPGWAGNSSGIPGNQNGWIKAEYVFWSAILNNYPEVWFRFHFCSDPLGVVNGFAIDDFCINEVTDIDAGILSVNTFSSPVMAGSCNNLFPVLKNFGALMLNQTTINYSVDGNTPVSFVWTGNLWPGATTVVPIGCYTVPVGPHTVCIWTSTPGDTVTYHDTTCVEGFGIQVLNASICHDFETNNDEFFTVNGGINEWELGSPAYGVTTGAHSGINAWDINLTTTYAVNAADTLYSSAYLIDSLMSPTLSFWHNRNILTENDGYWIEYQADIDTGWTQLGVGNDVNSVDWYNTYLNFYVNKPVWDGNSLGWHKSTYFLKYITGIDSMIRFRFIFKSTFNAQGIFDGVSIDDFCIIHPGPIDASVSNVSLFAPTPTSGSQDSIIVKIRNFGSANLTAADIYFSVDGGSPIGPYHWTGIIPPTGISSNIYLLNFPFTVPAGAYDICAWIVASNDSDASNDTSCASFFGVETFTLTYANPYCDDFEGAQTDWTSTYVNSNTMWEWGMPSYGTTNSTHSGLKCWDINLTTPYQGNAHSELYSPIFQIPANGNAVLSFYQNKNTEQNWDGVRLEYSTNGGITWVILGGANSPPTIATNWYNMNSINCSSLPAWAGNAGWLQSVYKDLSFLNGTSVRFRFIFCSDASVNVDGFSIDDFCLVLSPLVSASTTSAQIVNPIAINFPGQCYSFTTNFTNTGVSALSSVNTFLFIDGNMVSSGTVTFNPFLTTGVVSNTFTFPNCWTATPGTHTVCMFTSNPNGGYDYNVHDDTLCFTVSVLGQEDLTSGVSYCEDFEAAQAFLAVNGITYSNISTWKYGLPSKTFLNDVNSGSKAWVTNLTQMYPANDNSALLTQMFILNTNTSYALRFYTKFKTEYMNDGGTVQYSTDYGNSWITLGDNNSPQWMNTSNIIAISPNPPPNISGWSGTSVWQQMQHHVCFPSTQGTIPINVLFRFLFMSDVFTQDEGWEIDDFCIEPDTGICTVGLYENASATEPFIAGIYPNPAKEKLTLSFYIPKDGMVDYVISDITGKSLIHSENISYQKGLHEIDLTSFGFTPGSYFYSVRWDNQIKNGKLVITGN